MQRPAKMESLGSLCPLGWEEEEPSPAQSTWKGRDTRTPSQTLRRETRVHFQVPPAQGDSCAARSSAGTTEPPVSGQLELSDSKWTAAQFLSRNPTFTPKEPHSAERQPPSFVPALGSLDAANTNTRWGDRTGQGPGWLVPRKEPY